MNQAPYLIAGTLLLSACASETEMAQPGETTAQARQSVAAPGAPDPSYHTPLGGLCKYSYTWKGVQGRIYHAPYGGCQNMRYSPLVVVLPAKNYNFRRYNFLLKHLAKNGFAAVSVNTVQDEQGADAVADALSFLKSLRTRWSKSTYIDRSRVGLIGHSRGGGSVIELAQALEDPVHTFSVQAIMTMAPRYEDLAVDYEMAPALLALQGTHDGDMIPERSFELYDNSGTEGSVFANGVDRAMKLFHSANHESFAMAISPTGSVSSTSGSDVAQGYALAFMAHHLLDDDTWYDAYVRGWYQPGSWFDDIDTQYADGTLRYVVDNAEHGQLTPTTSGVGLANLDLGTAANAYHDTRVYYVLTTAPSGTLTWNVPSQNLSPYHALSLRIGQLSTALSDDVEISIRNGGSWSAPVSLAQHGRIGRPSTMCDQGTGTDYCSQTYLETRQHMTTIRVPLAEFGDIDDVERVRLSFSSNSAYREFYVDSVEFSTWSP